MGSQGTWSSKMTNSAAKHRQPAPKTRRRRHGGAAQKSWIDELLERQSPSFSASHLPEPKLLFDHNGRCEDPKTGLALYGPFGGTRGGRSRIRVGIVGSSDTIDHVQRLLESMRGRITPGLNSKGKPYDLLLAPDFPGFAAESPFGCDIEVAHHHVQALTGMQLAQALAEPSTPVRIAKAVDVICDRLSVLADAEPPPDVVICAIPAAIEEVCRRQAHTRRQTKPTKAERARKRWLRRSEQAGQTLLEFGTDDDDSDAPAESWDFHNALKAKAMRFGLATQLIWESTFTAPARRQDPATVAWNLSAALYYKAGNVPWSLDALPGNTCFVGLAFYRESHDSNADLRTSVAQVFSQSGDGLIMRGERAFVDTDGDRRPHLARDAAQRLLAQAIDLYERHYGQRPGRVVVHKTSRYYPDELAGFQDGLSGVTSFDFLTLSQRGIQFFRAGQEPPLRGTLIRLAPRNYLLYTAGYVPHLRVYPGPRAPHPLEVLEHHGDSSPEKVCSEILALTKVNWNACAFASRDPITIAFSRQVGSILRDLPPRATPQPKYRFYM